MASVNQMVQSLAFDVEAVPQPDPTDLTSAATSTPLNVKIRVKKRGEYGMEQGTLTVPKFNQPGAPPERVRLISSDQTIMSFDVAMEADFANKPKRKHRKYFFGGCLGMQYDDDESTYLPSTNNMPKTAERNVASKSDGIIKQNFALSKKTYAAQSHTKKPDILGKCKPGGCLDPPFDEQKYAYEPVEKHKRKVMSIDDDSTPAPEKIKLSKRIDTPFETDKMKNSAPYNITKLKAEDNSILSLFEAKPKTSFDSKYSDSIMTYPPDIATSTPTSNEKNLRNSATSETKPRKSYNDSVDAFFRSPRKTSRLSEKTNNAFGLDKLEKTEQQIEKLGPKKENTITSENDYAINPLMAHTLDATKEEIKNNFDSKDDDGESFHKSDKNADPILTNTSTLEKVKTNDLNDIVYTTGGVLAAAIVGTKLIKPMLDNENSKPENVSLATDEIQSSTEKDLNRSILEVPNDFEDTNMERDKKKQNLISNSQLEQNATNDITSSLLPNKKEEEENEMKKKSETNPESSFNSTNFLSPLHSKTNKQRRLSLISKESDSGVTNMDKQFEKSPTILDNRNISDHNFEILDQISLMSKQNNTLEYDSTSIGNFSQISHPEANQMDHSTINYLRSGQKTTQDNSINKSDENPDALEVTANSLQNVIDVIDSEETDIRNKSMDLNKTHIVNDFQNQTGLTNNMLNQTNDSDRSPIKTHQSSQEHKESTEDVNTLETLEPIIEDNPEHIKEDYQTENNGGEEAENLISRYGIVPLRALNTKNEHNALLNPAIPSDKDINNNNDYFEMEASKVSKKSSSSQSIIQDRQSVQSKSNVELKNRRTSLTPESDLRSIQSSKIRYQTSFITSDKTNDDSQTKTVHGSKSSLKRDSISVDLTFQSYMNENKQRHLRTVSTSQDFTRFPDDVVTVIQSQLRPHVNELRVPIDMENEMYVQLKRTRSPTQRVQIIEGESKIISRNVNGPTQRDYDDVDLTNSGLTDGCIKELQDKFSTFEMQKVLSTIYEQELVPLQKTIQNLKQDIHTILGQQSVLIEKLYNAIKAKPVRLIRVNSRCNCWKK